MLRLSKLTDYAVVVLTRLEDAEDGGVQTAPGLAAATGLAEPTVAKVLKILSQAGWSRAQRGARGGYRLTRPLAAMPLSEVIVGDRRPDRADRLRGWRRRHVRGRGHLPGARPLGPGERRDPRGAVRHFHRRPARAPAIVPHPEACRRRTARRRRRIGRSRPCPPSPRRSRPSSPSPKSGYKWGFETDIEMEFAPKGLNEDIVRFISRQEERARLAAGMAAEGLRAVEDDGGAALGRGEVPADRLPGRLLLRRAEEEGRSRSRWTRSIPSCCSTYAKLGIPLKRAGDPGRRRGRGRHAGRQGACRSRWTRCSTASPSPPPTRSGWRKEGIIFCSISEAVQEHPELVQQVPRHRRAAGRQFLRRAEQRGLHRWQLRLHPEGRALPDGAVHLFPHQCRRAPASSSAR